MFVEAMHKLGCCLKQCKALRIGLAVFIVVLAVLFTGWYKLCREVEQDGLKTPEEWFKYGSIGSEQSSGVPYWIWRIMPKMFPEYLPGPGGYAALGMPWEQGKDTPVGFSVKTIGVPRVAFNCALCHAARYRTEPAGRPQIVIAGPSHTVNAQGYARFIAAAANDARFNSDAMMDEIAKVYELPWLDRMIYRYLLIPGTKKALIKYGQSFGWTEIKPDWGPGRVDPFNPVKFGVLQMGVDETIGNSDMPPIWNMKAREKHAMHWDGLNTNFHEVVVSSAIGDGMTYKSIADENLERIENWLKDVPAPQSPYGPDKAADSPYCVDAGRVADGKGVFDRQCAVCHAADGKRTGAVIPVGEVGTDRHRVDMWTAEAAKRYNAYEKDYRWGFSHFQDVDGYVAVLLDGIWLRGPYLHNGSVPSLRDLLKRPEERPAVFYRGYDLLNTVDVGFVSQGETAGKTGFRYDTNVAGNGNGGHLYGTDLPEEQKAALLEFLKTL
jgi:mono/diheme cytochrome c family protein